MVSSPATTVGDYLASLPPDRRAAVSTVREVVRRNLPPGYEEGMQYGMIGWYVPLSRYPKTYNGQPLGIACLASQKNYMSLYLMTVYGQGDTERWLATAFAKAGKKLDMGKSCVRFRAVDDLPLEVIGEVIRRVNVDDFIAMYEKSRAMAKGGARRATKKGRPTRAKAARPKRAGAGRRKGK